MNYTQEEAMEMDAREDLERFKKVAAKEAALLHDLIQRANSEVREDVDVVRHADTELLLQDHDILQFGASRCRLPSSAILDFILFACYAFPDCLPDRLPAIAKFSIWLFFFDDLFDDSSNHRLATDPAATSAFMAEVLRFAVTSSSSASAPAPINRDCVHHSDIDGALLEDAALGLSEWWGEFRQLGMPTAQQRRFLYAFEAYAAAVVQQTRYVASGTFPEDMQAYAAMRADASLMHGFKVLVEFSMGVDVMSGLQQHQGPDETAAGHGRALEAVGETAVLELVWFNDLRSLAKEIQEGDCMNLISYLYVKERVLGRGRDEFEEGEIRKVEAALNVAVRMVWDCREEMRRLEVEIMAMEFDDHEKIKSYLRGIRRMVAGLEKWYYLSMRYDINVALEKEIVEG